MAETASPRGAIEIVSATKRFGDTVAVDSVNLKIPAANYCCLLCAHLAWTLPFGLLVMIAVFNRFNKAYKEAAHDLGAIKGV